MYKVKSEPDLDKFYKKIRTLTMGAEYYAVIDRK